MRSIGARTGRIAITLALLTGALDQGVEAAPPRGPRPDEVRRNEIPLVEAKRPVARTGLDPREFEERVPIEFCDWEWSPEGMVPLGPGCLVRRLDGVEARTGAAGTVVHDLAGPPHVTG